MPNNIETPAASGRRPRLLLVNPFAEIKQFTSNIGFAKIIGKKAATTPLALPLLAALAPQHWDVRIIDEELEPIPADIAADLVGITALTTTIDRAYEIADFFRGRGIKVVMGGPTVTYNSEEALLHADCVVAGEAEYVWKDVLDHAERGELRRVYRSSSPAAYASSPIPRWDLIDVESLAALPVQVSRGCPFRCDFCLVSRMFGQTMRYRSVDDVIAEIKSLPKKTLFFVDDNLTANKAFARELMKRLQPLGVLWIAQVSIEIADFPDLLADMAAAGCMHVLVGLESVNEASLGEAHKRQNNIARYSKAVRTIHRAGIHVNASMIVGFDNDTVSEFDKIREFLHAADLWYVNLNILDAIPGTVLHGRVVAEGRWSDRKNKFTGGMFPTIRYKNMSQVELFDALLRTLRTVYSWDDVLPRIERLYSTGWFTRPERNRDIKAVDKVRLTFGIVRRFLIEAEPSKRKVFLTLFRLVRKRKVAPEKIVFFLLTLEGIHRLFAEIESKIPVWRETIAAQDGPPAGKGVLPGSKS
jgi:radical SAM superfamily enzyme YgiQ (UPF0313 family)